VTSLNIGLAQERGIRRTFAAVNRHGIAPCPLRRIYACSQVVWAGFSMIANVLEYAVGAFFFQTQDAARFDEDAVSKNGRFSLCGENQSMGTCWTETEGRLSAWSGAKGKMFFL